VPFGNAIIKTNDTELGIEIGTEMYASSSLSCKMALDGAEIILNSGASYFE